jgi:hypothetical protein
LAITYHAGRRIQGTSTTVTNWVEANGTNGTGAGQYDSSNTSGDNSFNYDTTNGEIDFNVVRNSSTPNCMMKDITSSTNGLGTALSTTNWRMRFKIYWDNWEDQGDITLWLGLSSFSRSEAINGSNSNDVRKPTGGDIIGLQFTNAKLSNNCWNFVKFFYGENEDDTGRFGGDSTNHAVDLEVPNTILTSSNYNCNKPTDDTYYWCEIIRDGSTLTFNCSKTAYGNSDVCGASNSNTGKTTSGTATTTFGTTRPLKYFFVGKTGGTGETEPIQGMIRDLQIESTGSTVKPTNVQVGSRFEETDTRKMYYYVENNPTYTPDLSSSSGWALTNGGGTASIANDEITISADSNADNPVASFDLGSTLSDTKWLMTFKVVYSGWDNTNSGQGVISGIGISDLPTYSALDGWYPAGLAYISYEFLAHASSGTYAQTQVAGGNSSGRSETTGADIPSPYSATQYVKLYRLTSTTARMEYYGQADYSDTPTTINVTMSNAPSGLRYLFLRLMYQNVTSTNTIVASEFKIYNDTNTVPEATEWKELGT